MKDDQAPDTLRPDAGVSRLNKKPLAIIVVVLGAVVFALSYGLLSKTRRSGTRRVASSARQVVQTNAGAAASLAKDVPKTGPIPERPVRFRAGPKTGLIPAAPEPTRVAEAQRAETEAELEQRRRLAARRQQMLDTALTAVTKVATVDELTTRMVRADAKAGGDSGASGASAYGDLTPSLRSGIAGLIPNDDPNKQADKINFTEQKHPLGYLPNTRQPPLSDYELKAGTVIPAVLISGINSDLPGQILAQVTQNVYDSATGNYLLVPQGAKLVGIYDSRVSVGQSRVQVAWTRLNFPDSSTLELSNMPGTDLSGYSGFNDRTNNHVFRIFRDALMLSFISAGAQLSQPRTRGVEGQVSADQQIAAAIGQQFGAAGMEMAKRNAQIQPTIEIRPGYQFAVLVSKDIVLRPYRETFAH